MSGALVRMSATEHGATSAPHPKACAAPEVQPGDGANGGKRQGPIPPRCKHARLVVGQRGTDLETSRCMWCTLKAGRS